MGEALVQLRPQLGEGKEGGEGGEEDLASTSKGWKRSAKGTVRGAGSVVDWAG